VKALFDCRDPAFIWLGDNCQLQTLDVLASVPDWVPRTEECQRIRLSSAEIATSHLHCVSNIDITIGRHPEYSAQDSIHLGILNTATSLQQIQNQGNQDGQHCLNRTCIQPCPLGSILS